MGPQTPTGTDFVQEFVVGLAVWASARARAGLASLLQSFGESTEPDYLAIVPVYNRSCGSGSLDTGLTVIMPCKRA